jgi:nitroreductase
MQWRYATKKFDATKNISEENLAYLKEAMQLSASSYGLQPYEILLIKDQETKEKLLPASWNQSQITDASYVVVIANKTNFGNELVDEYVQNAIDARGISESDIADYANYMKNTLAGFSQEDKATWTAKQCYIVLANLLTAAAYKEIDACPMEGFQATTYNEILGLEARNLNAAVICTIGYRSNEDATQNNKKVRRPESQLFKNI